MSNCIVCGNCLPPKKKYGKRGIYCSKKCRRIYYRKNESEENKERQRKRFNLYYKKHKEERKKYILSLGDKCQKCGYDNILALLIHHKDNNHNNNNQENHIVLCQNCHVILHQKILN
jgi:5-methylcytosine-specific restriction endonuclease McrA